MMYAASGKEVLTSMSETSDASVDIFENAGQQVATKPPRKDVNLSSAIDDMVSCFTDPIIVWPQGGWADTIPQWLKEQVKIDRLFQLLKTVHGEKPTATDSEALLYMYPLALERPLDHDWTQIYLYLGTTVLVPAGKTVTDDIRVEELTSSQLYDLNLLKDFIYESRKKHRSELRRQGNREERKQKEESQEREESAVVQHSFKF